MNTYTILGRVLHFIEEPDMTEGKAYEYYEEGALVVKDGKVDFCGDSAVAFGRYPTNKVIDRRGKLIVPGLIDTHMHYAQTEMIGADGEQLWEWL